VHDTTAAVLKHGKALRAIIKTYSIFTRFLQHLYDFPPSLCHTPQRQGLPKVTSGVKL